MNQAKFFVCIRCRQRMKSVKEIGGMCQTCKRRENKMPKQVRKTPLSTSRSVEMAKENARARKEKKNEG